MHWSLVFYNVYIFVSQRAIYNIGDEVDMMLEGPGGEIVALEVKSSESVSSDDFKGLRRAQVDLGAKFRQGIVLYAGSMHVSFGPGLHAVPISALWLE